MMACLDSLGVQRYDSRPFDPSQKDSAYTHIAIGNFFDPSVCDTAFFDGSPFPPDPIYLKTYYYIENVCAATDPAFCNSPTGLSEVPKKNQYTLYPNPASTDLHLENLNEKSVYRVFDVQGREVRTGTAIPEQSIFIGMSANGPYIFQLETSNGAWTERFIKIP